MIFEYEHIFRVHLLGFSCSGISTLSNKFFSHISESQESIPWTNILFSRYTKLIVINNKAYLLQLWIHKRIKDEKEAFEVRYLKNANAIILMYDITNIRSLDFLVKYIQLIKKNKINLPIILVGNKRDLEEKREIIEKQAIHLVKQYQLSDFIEISAISGRNVEFMFETLTKLMLQNFDLNIWKIVRKYIWYDKRGFPHFDGDDVSEEDYDIIYEAYHPLQCTYCWIKEHCKYYPNIEDCEVHSWFASKEYKDAKNDEIIDFDNDIN